MASLKIFLSYQYDYQSIAESIQEALIDEGYQVFWDQDILVGAPWEIIRDRELQDADVLVAVLGNADEGSGVSEEIKKFWRPYFLTSERPYLIPVRASNNVPFPPQHLDHIISPVRWLSWEGYNNPIDLILQALSTIHPSPIEPADRVWIRLVMDSLRIQSDQNLTLAERDYERLKFATATRDFMPAMVLLYLKLPSDELELQPIYVHQWFLEQLLDHRNLISHDDSEALVGLFGDSRDAFLQNMIVMTLLSMGGEHQNHIVTIFKQLTDVANNDDDPSYYFETQLRDRRRWISNFVDILVDLEKDSQFQVLTQIVNLAKGGEHLSHIQARIRYRAERLGGEYEARLLSILGDDN